MLTVATEQKPNPCEFGLKREYMKYRKALRS
jgi:hypothetical protein